VQKAAESKGKTTRRTRVQPIIGSDRRGRLTRIKLVVRGSGERGGEPRKSVVLPALDPSRRPGMPRHSVKPSTPPPCRAPSHVQKMPTPSRTFENPRHQLSARGASPRGRGFERPTPIGRSQAPGNRSPASASPGPTSRARTPRCRAPRSFPVATAVPTSRRTLLARRRRAPAYVRGPVRVHAHPGPAQPPTAPGRRASACASRCAVYMGRTARRSAALPRQSRNDRRDGHKEDGVGELRSRHGPAQRDSAGRNSCGQLPRVPEDRLGASGHRLR
jgi:hypothetical protein